MNGSKKSFTVLFVLVIGVCLSFSWGYLFSKEVIFDNYRFKIKSLEDVTYLFPKSVENIKKQKNRIFKNSKNSINNIIALDNKQRTFENTVLAIDKIVYDLTCLGGILSTVGNVYTDKLIRDQALASAVEIDKFEVDFISGNRGLYKAFRAYVDNRPKGESLDEQQEYFITHLQDSFERGGLGLSDEDLEKVKILNKQIAVLSSEFQKNINLDNRSILVKEKELLGLEKDFIKNLKKNKDGLIIIGIDYPTYFNVMKHCSSSDTRKKLYTQYANRGYPKNDVILKDIIKKRDKLAKLLGYKSYSAFDCANQMIKTDQNAESFILNLFEPASKKAKKELDLFLQKLDGEVKLAKDNKANPWDSLYLATRYKKKYFDLDDNEIAQYLPVEKVLDTFIGFCKTFFGLDLTECSNKGLWHNDLKVFKVARKSDSSVLGYLILDLYPRKDKYPHACEIPAFSSFIDDSGHSSPKVVSIIANFPKSTRTKPSLLKLNDVSTFFHECGHALHELLGITKIASFAGTNTKIDFVEVPSQLMEMFIVEPEFLKMMSSHYKTGQSFSDELIDKIVKLKNLTYGQYVQHQLYSAMLSLNLFKDGEDKEPKNIVKDLHQKMLKQIAYVDFVNMHTGFIHLAPSSYGAKYYCYMYSRVLALDIFDYIKKNGIFNPQVGKKYIDTILSKGGSVDPNILISNFLGRAPNNKAFIKYYDFE